MCQNCTDSGDTCVAGTCTCDDACELGEVSCDIGGETFKSCGQGDPDECLDWVPYRCDEGRLCQTGCLPECTTAADCGGVGDTCVEGRCVNEDGHLAACPACDVDGSGCVDADVDGARLGEALAGSGLYGEFPRFDIDGGGYVNGFDISVFMDFCWDASRCPPCDCASLCDAGQWWCLREGEAFVECGDIDGDGCLEPAERIWDCAVPDRCDVQGCFAECSSDPDCDLGVCDRGVCYDGMGGTVPCPFCDFDENGCVDWDDYEALAAALEAAPTLDECPRCDMNGDAVIETQDLEVFYFEACFAASVARCDRC